ncbi:MAG: hypothetical protein B2I17_07775 [Thermoplasmatales archaeon B_DKE]|nr:MAG: hypothetical protein B2I17_07775 [Thermoplasmatales archaeon B_DKE]
MNAKAIALMVVGIVLVSFVFSYFHVEYPTGIPNTDQHIQVFQIQGYNGIGLGNGKTTINPQGKSTVVIQGFIKNASSNSPLENTPLYAFLSLADTSTVTSGNGFYKIAVLYTGTYTLAFKSYSYKTDYVSLSVFGNSVWNNMSFTPAHKFAIEGETLGFNSLVSEPDISMNLQGFFGPSDFISAQSNSQGYFNISAYNDSYHISVTTPQYDKVTVPAYLNVSGTPKQQPELIHVLPLRYYDVSGFIFNNLSEPVTGAAVQSLTSSGSVLSNATGFYNLSVQYGSNVITATKQGFGNGFKTIYVTKNTTDVNITLLNNNPFSGGQGKGTGTGVGGIPPSAGGNITRALQGNTSSVNYGKASSNTSYSLSGNVTDNVTKQRVAHTEIRFYLNVNGTIFYENVTTNGTGHYDLVFQYPGNYILVAYSPFYDDYKFSYNITGNQHKNFSLTPFGNHVYTVSGYVKNVLGKVLKNVNVTANYVYALPAVNVSSQYNLTNSNGKYSMKLFEANYTFSASGSGYSTNYTGLEDVNSNLTDVNITLPYMNPFTTNSGSGTSGVGSPQLSNLTSFLAGSGNGSTVYYNETGGPGKYNITGIVTNSNNSLPVFDTHLEFFANVSGTTYSEAVQTGYGGQYVLNLSYKGNYTLAVYSKEYYLYIQNFTVRGNLDRNFDMTPIPAFVHAVNGVVLNEASYPVNTSKITVNIGDHYYIAKQNSTNSSGNYSIYLVNDTAADYSLHFVAPGFYNNSSAGFPVTGNLAKQRIVMTPLVSIGNGVHILSSPSITGSPSLSASSLTMTLGSKADNHTYAISNNSTDPVTLNISLVNSSSSKGVKNTQFIGYIKIDGAIYRFINYTNSNGNYDLRLNLSGSMDLLVSTLNYSVNTSGIFNFQKNTEIKENLTEAKMYSNTIHLNSTYNKTWQIPDNLSITNSLFSMNNTPQKESNGTNYTYYVQNGTYEFAFTNISYVPVSFYSNISGSNHLKNRTLVNYILEIVNNSNLSWTYSITPKAPLPYQNHVALKYAWVNLTSRTYTFDALINGTVYAQKTFTLNLSYPEEILEFNATKHNKSFTFTNNLSGSIIYTNVTINTNGNISIYKFGVSRNWTSGSPNLSINGSIWQNVNQSSGSYTNFSLHPFYKYVPETMIMFEVSGSVNYKNGGDTAVVYYYDTSLSGSNVGIS